MVRLVSEIRVKELVTFGFDGILRWGFESHKDRINFAEDLRVVVLEYPALLSLIVREEDSEAHGLLARPFFLPPDAVAVACVLNPAVVQVIRIKDQGFTF